MPTLTNKTASDANAVSIFIAYDHSDAAARAELLCERLVQKMGLDLDSRLWRFDIVDMPEVEGEVESDFTDSDVVMIAWKKPGAVPDSVMGWLDRWAQSTSRQDRLLAAMPVGNFVARADFPVLDSLKSLASRNGLAFLAQEAQPDEKRGDESVHKRERRTDPKLHSILRDEEFGRPMEWGIND